MKSLIAALALLPCLAFATPKIGDAAYYEGSDDGRPIRLTHRLSEYYPDQQKYETTRTQFEIGGASTNYSYSTFEELYTSKELKEIVANCRSLSGFPQKITTAAGTFETCKQLRADGAVVVNLGVVPFGIVRYDDGLKRYEIVRFTKN